MTVARTTDQSSAIGPGRRLNTRDLLEWAGLVIVCSIGSTLAWTVFAPAELGLDGYLSVGLASLSVADLLSFAARDVHPPLFYLALKAWLAVAGTTVVTARIPSVLCGCASLLLVSRLVRDRFGPGAGLVAAAMMAFSPAWFLLSATVRDFAPGLALSLGSTLALIRLVEVNDLRGRGVGWRLVAFAALTGLAINTWYFHAVFALAQVVAIVVSGTRRKRTRLVALGGGLALSIPWALYAGPGLALKLLDGTTVGGETRELVSVGAFLTAIGPGMVGDPLGHIQSIVWNLAAPAAWLAVAGASGLAVANRRIPRDTPYLAFGGSGLAAGLAVVFLLRSGWVGNDDPARYLLFVLPFGHLLMAAAFGRLSIRGRPVASLAVAVLVASGLALHSQLSGSQPIVRLVERPVAHVVARASDSDAFVFSDIARLGMYRVMSGSHQRTTLIHFAGSRFLRDDVAATAGPAIARIADGRDRVWFVNTSANELGPTWLVDGALADKYYLAERTRFSATEVVSLYVKGPKPAIAGTPADLGGQVRLVGAAVADDATRGTLFVRLEWETLRRPDADYTVFVQLVGPSDAKAAASDSWPRADTVRLTESQPGVRVNDDRMLFVDPGAADGEYRLLVGLYSDSVRLRLPDGADSVTIATARIEKGRIIRLDARR